MMENFETLTSAVECNGDDGIMSLTFKNQEALDTAVQKWQWINAKEEDNFLMITNHDGCGPDSERVPYV